MSILDTMLTPEESFMADIWKAIDLGHDEKALEYLRKHDHVIRLSERKMTISECIEAVNNSEPSSGSNRHYQWDVDMEALEELARETKGGE